MAYILGVTGGIASGKSWAAKCLERPGVYIIEVDDLSRPMLQPGTEIYHKIIETFGRKITNIDGSINRKRLGRQAFSTPQKTRELNDIFREPLTQSIKFEIMAARANRAKLIIVVAAIMFEQGWNKLCHGVLNISAPESIRTQRAVTLGMTEAEVFERMVSQLSERERMKLSNWTIYTQPTPEAMCDTIRKFAQENKWI
jgi:dephospho-CoA kinase